MVITKNDYKFAGIEPDKPLNDAQMVGSSIFIGFRSLISFNYELFQTAFILSATN